MHVKCHFTLYHLTFSSGITPSCKHAELVACKFKNNITTIITNCFKMCKFITCLLNLSIDVFFLQEVVSLWESQECLSPGKNLKFRVPSPVISAWNLSHRIRVFSIFSNSPGRGGGGSFRGLTKVFINQSTMYFTTLATPNKSWFLGGLKLKA